MVPVSAMKVLVIGGGGREHALAWKLEMSAIVEHVWCIPGNGGIADEAECIPIVPTNSQGILKWAAEHKPNLTVVGPEQPLIEGIVDDFSEHGLPIIGPSRTAARLEGSKIFAKRFLDGLNIPTASVYGICDSIEQAEVILRGVQWPVVIKADGLCQGKGVLVAESRIEAMSFIERLLNEQDFGEAGRQFILEEALSGKELSFIVLTDGEHLLPFVPTRDHKRVFDDDQGPNTGGMGAFSADGMIPEDLEEEIINKVVRPTLVGIAREGSPYVGFLYCGLMLTQDGPKVLEYNCRLGDPECQAIIARMDFDLGKALWATCEGHLDRVRARWRPGSSVCLVLASSGYPGHYERGKPIDGLADAGKLDDVVIFHAGTRRLDHSYVTDGGRVLGVTATGPNLAEAAGRAYEAARHIRFDGMNYRKDIGILK